MFFLKHKVTVHTFIIQMMADERVSSSIDNKPQETTFSLKDQLEISKKNHEPEEENTNKESNKNEGKKDDKDDDGEIFFVDNAGNRFKKVLVDGIVHNHFPNLTKILRNLSKLHVRDDDILIAAYQSCGTHWLWEIVSMLLNGKPEYIDGVKEKYFLEMTSIDEKSMSPRILNTHLLPINLPRELINGRCKVIYITRNPKDVMASNYNHSKNSERNPFLGNFQDYFDLEMKKTDEYTMLTWMYYTKVWDAYFMDHPHVSVLRLYYEDMKEDLTREIRVIAEYLSVTAEDTLVREIADRCTFLNMKVAKSALHPSEKNMYRTGKSGTWKDYFTVAMNERFDKEFEEQMANSATAERLRFSL